MKLVKLAEKAKLVGAMVLALAVADFVKPTTAQATERDFEVVGGGQGGGGNQSGGGGSSSKGGVPVGAVIGGTLGAAALTTGTILLVRHLKNKNNDVQAQPRLRTQQNMGPGVTAAATVEAEILRLQKEINTLRLRQNSGGANQQALARTIADLTIQIQNLEVQLAEVRAETRLNTLQHNAQTDQRTNPRREQERTDR